MNTRMLMRIFKLATVFLIMSIVSSWAVPPDQNESENVLNEAKKGGYQLINVDQLWDIFQHERDSLVLVDTRQEWEHYSGYIKGSVNFPMEPTWLSRLTQRGALEQFLGPDKSKTLVFY